MIEHDKVYQNYMEYLIAAQGPKPKDLPIEKCASLTTKDTADNYSDITWYGTDTFEDAVNLAINGDHELEKKVQEIADQIYTNISHKEFVPDFFFSEVGDDVDVSRFLEGDPECMIYTEPVPKERKGGRIISIVIQGCTSGYTKREYIINRGASILALSQLLEKSHYRTEIILFYGTHKCGVQTRELIKLKRPEDRFDLQRLCFCLISPAALRRIQFAYSESQYSKQIRRAFGVYKGGGYGEVDNSTIPNGDLKIPDNTSCFITKEYCQRWIEQKIKELKGQ